MRGLPYQLWTAVLTWVRKFLLVKKSLPLHRSDGEEGSWDR
jgi:hypothetical protein